MHLTCKNNPVKLTGIFGRFGVRNLSEVFLRLSSDAAQIADCENRTVFWIWTCWKNVVPVLGLAGCHFGNGKLQVRFHSNIAASSLAADCNVPQRPPAWNCCLTNRVNPVKPNRMINQMAAESRSFTSFQMVHTHTHMCLFWPHVGPCGCLMDAILTYAVTLLFMLAELVWEESERNLRGPRRLTFVLLGGPPFGSPKS